MNVVSMTPSSPNPTTPNYPDNVEWITAYFVIHMMSDPSRRYGYLLWSIVALVFLTAAILHWSGMTGGVIGAYWMKWALRRRTFRQNQTAKITGEPSHPISLPSNGQLLSLALLLASTLVLCFVGPDYLAPSASILSFKRDIAHVARATAYDESLFYQYQPQYTISKAWWTSGGRAGIIAFALIPLCVLLALKAPPFALFANQFVVQLHFDKLAWLHRWSGRLIWLVTAIHVALWSVQLGKDHRAGVGGVAFQYAWQYDRFVYAWIAFGLLTLLILCSMNPLRKHHYELFYYMHIFLFVSFMIMSALHHPPLWWWCWGSLALWIGERFWRATWWLYINGFGRMSKSVMSQHTSKPSTIDPAWELKHIRSSIFTVDSIPLSLIPRQNSAPFDISDPLPITHGYYPLYSPPPGYAHAELLSGRTVRLTYISPGYRSWAPGQYFLLNIPSISKFVSHPFTCATICDEQAPADDGRTMIFLIRTKAGWTKTLWDTLITLLAHSRDHVSGENLPHGTVMPKNGVLLRMYVDGPFGSSGRSRWESHSTVVIIAGGSGVSFGLSVLEYVCLCLAGRDGKHLGGRSGGWGMKRFATHRVRFVWLVREFSHIQWAASVLRHCMAMIPAPGLLVNIFVTNFKPVHYNTPNYLPSSRAVSPQPDAINVVDNRDPHSTHLAHQRASDNDDAASYVDLTAYTGVYGDEEPISVDLGLRENYTLDLTNFDGECDSALPGEEMLSRRVRKAGMIRREKSRTTTNRHVEDPRPHIKGNSLHARRMSAERLLSPTWHPAESDHLSAEVDLGNAKATSLDVPWSLTHTPHAKSPLSPHPHSARPSPLALNIEAFPQSEFIGAATAGTGDYPHSAVSADWDATSDTGSVRALIHEVGKGAGGEEVSLVIDQRELHDVTVVSEYARPGKPKLDRILADEIEQAQGSIIVACCGPTSLDAMVRKSIAIQIDPKRLQRGDMRGSISLVSEEFQY